MMRRQYRLCGRCALLMLLTSTAGVPAAAAQAPEGALREVLEPGTTAWITEAGGRETRMTVVSVDGQGLTARAGDEVRRIAATDIARVRVRAADSILDGLLIGAGAAVASGLILCRTTEAWENCRDDVGPMIKIGLLGAGIGAASDALIRGRRTVFEARPRVQVLPLVGADGLGLRVGVTF